MLEIIRRFIVAGKVRVVVIFALLNLVLWYGNIVSYHLTWWIMILVMIGGSLFLLVLWSIRYDMQQKEREKIGRRKMSRTSDEK